MSLERRMRRSSPEKRIQALEQMVRTHEAAIRFLAQQFTAMEAKLKEIHGPLWDLKKKTESGLYVVE